MRTHSPENSSRATVPASSAMRSSVRAQSRVSESALRSDVQRMPADSQQTPHSPADIWQQGAGHAAGRVLRMSEHQVQRQKQEDPKDKEIKELATTIAGIINPSITGNKFKYKWTSIEKQIKSPVTKVPDGMKDFSGIYAKDVVDKLNAFTEDQRALVATEVQNQVIKQVTGVEGADILTEYNSLDSFVRGNIEKGDGSSFAGYVGAREALMAKFGSVAKINEYYKGLVSADFPSSKVKGYNTKVHANLHTKLQKAVTLMKSKKTGDKTWLEVTEEGIKSIGGINIRENRNNTSELSFHSFGWAIDIDASLNPNVESKSFPKTLVEGITGEDVYGGDDAKAMRKGGTADELLAHAQALRDASDTFKKAFSDEASFKSAITTYLTGQGLTLTETQTNDLYTLLTQVSTKKGSTVTVKNVETWLSDTNTANTRPATGGATTGTATTPTPWAKAETAASFLTSMYSLFEKSGGKSGKKVSASVTGTPATIAAHGFLNLPAELITALTASDGAGLKWLGGLESGTKDFMHFELKKDDQPTIVKDPPKSEEGSKD